mgnify:CR=1 FL=1|tara:strand:+ start:87 stop:914 length:828 start_codon:yes stop_codon:yes gene_type:complete
MQNSKAALIAGLKARIAGYGPVNAGSRSAISLGAREMDAALPDGGLRSGALHEIAASAYSGMGAATGFLAALVACAARASSLPVLWCETVRSPFDTGRLYGPGLSAFGVDPANLVLVDPPRDTDCLLVMEEALRSRAFAAVVGEMNGSSPALNLTATRRLQLAAEEAQTPVLFFTGHAKEGAQGASVAVSRWRIASAPSAFIPYADESEMLPGCPRWEVELIRSRGGRPGKWLVEWRGRECAFSVIAPEKPSHAIYPSSAASAADKSEPPFRKTA